MNNSVSTYCNMHTMHTLASIHSTIGVSMHELDSSKILALASSSMHIIVYARMHM